MKERLSNNRSIAEQLGAVLGRDVPAVTANDGRKKPSTDVEESEPKREISAADVESGAVMLEIFGVAKSLEILGAESVNARPYGYGRAQDALRRAVDLALLNGVLGEVKVLKERFSATLLIASSRACDFDAAVDAAYEAVRCGAASHFIREADELREATATLRSPTEKKSTPPAPPEWPKERQAQDRACEEYRRVLCEWEQQFTRSQIISAGVDVGSVVSRWFEKNRRETREECKRVSREAIADFERTGNHEQLLQVEKTSGGFFRDVVGDSGEDILAKSEKWAWKLVLGGILSPNKVKFPPSTEWLEGRKGLHQVLSIALGALPVPGKVLFRRVIELSGKEVGEAEALVVFSKGRLHAIYHDGGHIQAVKWTMPRGCDDDGVAEEDPRVYPTQPSAEGWVATRKKCAVVYSRENYNALQVALTCRKGNMDVRAWVKHYARHPQAGFGMFDFWAVAGIRHRSNGWVSIEDGLADRMDAILRLPDVGDVKYPDNIFFLPAMVGRVKKGEGVHGRWTRWTSHLRYTEGRAPSVAHVYGVFNDTVVKGGSATFMEELEEVTRGDSIHLLIAIMEEGKEIWMSSGLALRNESGKIIEIPGGAMRRG